MSSQPTESTGMLEFAAWLDVNKQRIGIIVGAVVVVGFGYWAYNQRKAGVEASANNALTQVTIKSERRTGGTPATADDYLKVASEFPGTAAAERAQLLAAGKLFTDGKFTEAKAKFEEFSAQHPDSSLLSVAAFGAAASLDGANDLEKAMAAYKQVSVNFPNEPAGPQSKLAMAAIYESKNQLDEALKIYNELAPELDPQSAQRMQQSPFSNDASQRRDLIYEKHPMLSPNKTLNLPGMPGLNLDTSKLKMVPAKKADATKAPATAPAPAPTAPKGDTPPADKK